MEESIQRAVRNLPVNEVPYEDVPLKNQPSQTEKVVHIHPSRSMPPGFNAMSSRSLQMEVRLVHPDAEAIAGRLDSGADITLLSEEYCLKHGEFPKPRLGMKLRLYQLTGDAKVLGYVRIPLYVKTLEGTTLCFSTEAYVVRGMNVPLLLGEDFQTSYKFNIQRYDNGDHRVKVGESPYYIQASGSKHVELGFEVRRAFSAESIGRKFAGKRALARRQRQDRQTEKDKGYVRAAHDYTIPANSVYNIEVRAAMDGRKEWLVEKVILGQEDGSVLAAPLTWISADDPRIPMANPARRLVS
ncbi:hypothetical protein BDZ89DRAFT_963576 [Hymenopellis radicata]|nr:hypothetical protein BDZ89DRAFT_963576 [Hymenopellis radicata]